MGDDIARIYGLDEVMAGELVEFEEGTIGIALNLKSNNVGVVFMGDGLMIQEGSSVKATGKIAQIPVSEAYLDRVINALAKPIDGRGAISSPESRLIESPALGIILRRFVYKPLFNQDLLNFSIPMEIFFFRTPFYKFIFLALDL